MSLAGDYNYFCFHFSPSVRLTREAVLDSHFLVLASNLGSQQAQQLQTHLVTFDPDTFVQKLVSEQVQLVCLLSIINIIYY